VFWVTLKVTGTETKRRIPWVVMTSDATDSATRAFFEEKAFFGLEKSQASSVWFPCETCLGFCVECFVVTFFMLRRFLGAMQVWFLKQSSLPCVDLNEGHAMLMETPWKVAMAPAGNGALFSDLRAAGFIKKLSSQGIKYVQVNFLVVSGIDVSEFSFRILVHALD
jgi:UDP-N-acetylglucosamine/UDP-N-acetylgalactosamine diphosphorylase